MASVSKNVAIFPAAAAGCTATCTGTQTDYSDGSWVRDYQISATVQGAWRFVSFEWDSTLSTSTGSSTTTHNSTTFNPDGLREWLTYFGSSSLWEQMTVSNVVANFAPTTTTYTISTAVSPAGGGTTTGDGTYNSGATANLTATANSGYMFLRWELNGVTASTSAAFSVTVTGNATYTAVFRQFTNLLVNSSTYGTPVRLVYDDRSGGTGLLVADY